MGRGRHDGARGGAGVCHRRDQGLIARFGAKSWLGSRGAATGLVARDGLDDGGRALCLLSL